MLESDINSRTPKELSKLGKVNLEKINAQLQDGIAFGSENRLRRTFRLMTSNYQKPPPEHKVMIKDKYPHLKLSLAHLNLAEAHHLASEGAMQRGDYQVETHKEKKFD